MKHAIVRPRPFAFTAAIAVALVGAASSLHATIVQNGLQAWFSADATSTVNGGSIANGGSVSAWANQGALGSAINVSASGSAQPIYVQNGIDRGGGVYQPVIRFNRDLGNTTTTVGSPNRMVTSGNTDLGIVNDSTWFIVFNPLVSNAQQGLFGLNSSANRFGAFYTGSTNQLRYMNFTDPDTVIQPTIPTAGVNISDSRRSGGGSVAMSGRLNGNTFANSDQTTSLNATTPVSTQFRIGNQLDGVPNNFVGDIAEVIVYNRALNDAERIIVENRLSAKYGTTLAANDLYAGKTTGNGNYDLDLIGIGDKTVTGTALNPGSVTTSEDGGGLKLAALNNSLNSDGEFLLAGRASDAANSWTAVTVGGINYARWSRDWYLDKTTADSLDAKFTFDFSLAPGASQPTSGSYALLYKSSLGGSWTDLGLAATVAGQQVSFNVLNANLSDGYYTLGMIPEPSTIFLLLCGGGLVWAWFRRGRRW